MQRIGSTLTLTPCDGGIGYSVTKPPNGMPRCTVGQDTLDTLRIVEGKWDAEIKAGAIVVA